jgi:putative peptidoglycan lipid II flippase
VPLVASVSAVAANLAWNVATFRRFGHVGLALGTSIAATVNLAVLLVAFQRQVRGLFSRELLWTLARILVASGVMAAGVWASSRALESLPGRNMTWWAAKALLPVGAGAALYFVAARVLRLDEASTLLRRLRR